MSFENVRLGIWDYCTLSAIFVVTCAPGLWQVYRAKKTKTVREFISQSKKSGVFSIAMSIAATSCSSITFMGYPSDAFKHGLVFCLMSVGTICAIPVGVCLYLPVFYATKTVSIFEFVENRFNRNARRFFSAVYNLRAAFSSSLVIYSAALALNQATGFNLWISVVLISVICMLYSSLGGFRAVILTDVMQLIVMILVSLLILIKGYLDQGGFANVWNVNSKGKRTQFLMWESEHATGTTIWPILIGSFFVHTASYTKQSIVQRCMSGNTLAKANCSAVLGLLISASVSLTLTFTGLAMYAKFSDCDPLLSGQVKSRDQGTILFAAETLGFADGLLGIYFAGIVCSAISTLSSHINSSVSLIMEDFVKPIFPKLTESRFLKIAKIIGVIYGCIAVGLVAVVKNARGVVSAFFIINGMFAGPLLGLFTLGMLSPWTSTMPALLGCTASMFFIGWASIGRQLTSPPISTAPLSIAGCSSSINFFLSNFTFNDTQINFGPIQNHLEPSRYYFPLYTFHPYWYACWSISLSIVLGLLATVVIGSQNPEDVDSKLIFPFVVRLIRKLPMNWKKRLGFPAEDSKFLDDQNMNGHNDPISAVECCAEEKVQLNELRC